MNCRMMKKIIACLILILIINTPTGVLAYNPFTVSEDEEGIPAPVITGVSITHSPDMELEVSSTGTQILGNIDFVDVRNHWSAKYVYKMAARSVIRGYGSKRFRPESPITRQEVIALLLRIMGREEQVQRQSETAGTGVTGNAIIDLWAEGYVELAYQLGIAGTGGDANWKAPATREEVAVWFARALNLEPVYGTRQQYIYTFNDWKAVSLQNLPYIEAVLQAGIMKGDGNGSFRPRSSIKRSEVAVMLYNVAQRFNDNTGFDSVKGQILQIAKEGSATLLGMVDTGGNIVSIRLPEGQSFPVFKENYLGNHSLIQVGDEIALMLDQGEVVYAEVDNSGSIQKDIIQGMAANPGWNTFLGTIVNIINRDEWNGSGYITRPYYRVVNIDGQIYDITPLPGGSSGFNDIPVYINGKLSGIDSLKVGDSIQYGVKNNRVYYISVVDSKRETVRGYFQDLKDGLITFYDYEGTLKSLPVSDSAKVMINQRDAALTDLKYGQEIEVKTTFGVVTEITAMASSVSPGYIPSGSRVRAGTISTIADNRIVLKTDGGEMEEYFLSGYTSIYKNGYRSDFSQIRPGDHVKIYLDDIYTNVASRIDIASGSQIVKCLARGELDRVSTTSGELYIRNYTVLENGRWVKKDYKATVKVGDDTGIYYKGQEIDLIRLQKAHKGDRAYLAVTDWFGGEKAVRVVVKDGYEAVYTDRVKDINWGTSEIELRDGRNILINEGTMIVANNRLVDMDILKEDFSVEAVVENSDGSRNALLVLVQDVNVEQRSIYAGRFNEIRTDEFDINYYTSLEGNNWGELEGSSDIETFYYDSDTVILDATDGYNIISASDFFNGDYASDNKYRRDYDYYGFVIASGDRASFVRLSKGGIVKGEERLYDDTLDKLRITTGEVSFIDYSIDTIEIKNARNWSEFYGDWEPADSHVYINYSKALITRDNRLINPEDLNPGDSLYIIRDDSRGLIILVQ